MPPASSGLPIPEDCITAAVAKLTEANCTITDALEQYFRDNDSWREDISLNQRHQFALYFKRYISSGFGGAGPQDWLDVEDLPTAMYPAGNKMPTPIIVLWMCTHKADKIEFGIINSKIKFKMLESDVDMNPIQDTPGPWTGGYMCVFKDSGRFIRSWLSKNFIENNTIKFKGFTADEINNEANAFFFKDMNMINSAGVLTLKSIGQDEFWLKVQRSHHPTRPDNDNGWVNPATANLPLRHALKAFQVDFPDMVLQSHDHNAGGKEFITVNLDEFICLFTIGAQKLKSTYDMIKHKNMPLDEVKAALETKGSWPPTTSAPPPPDSQEAPQHEQTDLPPWSGGDSGKSNTWSQGGTWNQGTWQKWPTSSRGSQASSSTGTLWSRPYN